MTGVMVAVFVIIGFIAIAVAVALVCYEPETREDATLTTTALELSELALDARVGMLRIALDAQEAGASRPPREPSAHS